MPTEWQSGGSVSDPDWCKIHISHIGFRLQSHWHLEASLFPQAGQWSSEFEKRLHSVACCPIHCRSLCYICSRFRVPPEKLVKRGILGISCSSSWPFMHLVFFSNFGSSLNGTVGGYWSYQRFSFGLGPSFAHRPIALRGPSARLPHLSSSCVLGPWGTGSPSARPFARHCFPASWQLASVDQVSVGLGSS